MTGDAAAPRRPRGRPGYSSDEMLRRCIEVFNERGFDATSMAYLAERLGVSKSAIFHHFDGKDAILAAALDEALGELAELVATTHDADSAYERLRLTVNSAVLILLGHLPAVTLLLRVRGNSEVELRALQRRRDIDRQLAGQVSAAIAEGSLRSDVDPDVVSRFIFGMVNSLTDWYRTSGSVDATVLATSVSTVLFDGLSTSR